jgi:hypothetical protein
VGASGGGTGVGVGGTGVGVGGKGVGAGGGGTGVGVGGTGVKVGVNPANTSALLRGVMASASKIRAKAKKQNREAIVSALPRFTIADFTIFVKVCSRVKTAALR